MNRRCLIVLGLFAIGGCGAPESGRVPIHGIVQWQGESVAGAISFRPATDAHGPAAGADIIDGEYTIAAESGPATGNYVAQITIVGQPAALPGSLRRSGQVTTFKVPLRIAVGQPQHDFLLTPNGKHR